MRFSKFVFCISFLTCRAIFADGLETKSNPILDARSDFQDIWGEPTNGLQPYVSPSPSRDNWILEVGFVAQADFSRTSWLLVTNRVGSKLELWQTNGVQVISKTPDVLGAFHVPKQTMATNILNFHSRRGRAYQWWNVGRPVYDGLRYPSASFNLRSAFDVSFTNDYVLKISPLIYKVETNEVTAHLVEFRPIKIKLMSNGGVQKIE